MAFIHSETFRVAQPIEIVFSFATNIKKRPQWQRHLRKAEKLTDGPVGIGTRFEEDGMAGVMVLKFTEFEQNKCIRYVTDKGKGVFADVSWTFSSDGDGTIVKVEVALTPLGLMKVLWPVMSQFMIAPQVRKDFRFLKDAFQKLD
jgi:uncharacterized protein YndB with AHSA1/START domain